MAKVNRELYSDQPRRRRASMVGRSGSVSPSMVLMLQEFVEDPGIEIQRGNQADNTSSPQ
jgi:hypothetical protein